MILMLVTVAIVCVFLISRVCLGCIFDQVELSMGSIWVGSLFLQINLLFYGMVILSFIKPAASW